MKLKRILSLVLASMLALGTGAALAEEAAVTMPEDMSPYYAETDKLDTSGKTYDKHLDITYAMPNLRNYVEDYNTADEMSRWFGSHFNVTWELEAIPGDGGNDKVRAMINGDTLPDILRWYTFDINEIADYIDQGYFYEFPEGWEERWPHLAQMQTLVPYAAALKERVGGGTYTLFHPVFFNNAPSEHLVSHQGVYIRKDWAEAVGFEIKDAYTMSEVMEFARLVKEQDPGQIGEHLVPISIFDGWARQAFLEASYPQQDLIYKENGKYVWGFADERTLAGLKLYKQAYDEGLLSPEYFVSSESDMINNFNLAGTAAVTINWTTPGTVKSAYNGFIALGLNPDDTLHIAALVGEDGYYHGEQNNNLCGNTYFNADIDPEAFERFMDVAEFAASREGQRLINVGFEGLNWEYTDDTKTTIKSLGKYDFVSGWPLYEVMAYAGDDFTYDQWFVKDPLAMLRDKYSIKIYEAKEARFTEDSLVPLDIDYLSYVSDAVLQLSNMPSYKSMFTNLVLADGDLEENWRKMVEEYRPLADAVINELNEKFCK